MENFIQKTYVEQISKRKHQGSVVRNIIQKTISMVHTDTSNKFTLTSHKFLQNLTLFSAFLETCFQKGSLIRHFVRLAGWLAGRGEKLLIQTSQRVLVFCISSVLSSYWRIGQLKVFKHWLNTITNDFLFSYEIFYLRFNFTWQKFEFFSTVISFEYFLTVNFVLFVQPTKISFCLFNLTLPLQF